MKGCDAYGPIPVSDLKANGYSFVCRYISQTPGKCITRSEYVGYLSGGIAVALVYEDNARDGEGGAATGAAKARLAIPILDAIDWPADRPVYFAFDMPGYAYDQPSFLACAVAFAHGVGREPAQYGDVDTCTYGAQHGIKYLWQFGEGRAPGISIYQSPSDIAPWGQPVDPDESLVEDFGQSPYQEATLIKDITFEAGQQELSSGIATAKFIGVSLKHPVDAATKFDVPRFTDVNGMAFVVCERDPDTTPAVVRVAYNA